MISLLLKQERKSFDFFNYNVYLAVLIEVVLNNNNKKFLVFFFTGRGVAKYMLPLS